MDAQEPTQHLRWYQRAVVRVLGCTMIGAVASSMCPLDFWMSGLLGWDVGSTLLLIAYLIIIFTSDVEKTRLRAAAWDPGRFSAWLLVSGGCLFSLGASLVLIGERETGVSSGLLVALCLWAVLSSWFLTHSVFTLRYAHLYYRGDEAGGLSFPGDEDPDDLDFAYFSFTMGMTFAASDLQITDRLIRRNALLHGILSFFYNTAILALALNLIFGHISR